MMADTNYLNGKRDKSPISTTISCHDNLANGDYNDVGFDCDDVNDLESSLVSTTDHQISKTFQITSVKSNHISKITDICEEPGLDESYSDDAIALSGDDDDDDDEHRNDNNLDKTYDKQKMTESDNKIQQSRPANDPRSQPDVSDECNGKTSSLSAASSNDGAVINQASDDDDSYDSIMSSESQLWRRMKRSDSVHSAESDETAHSVLLGSDVTPRFKLVRAEKKEPYKRGRWAVKDYYDPVAATGPKTSKGSSKTGDSSAIGSGVNSPKEPQAPAVPGGEVIVDGEEGNVLDGGRADVNKSQYLKHMGISPDVMDQLLQVNDISTTIHHLSSIISEDDDGVGNEGEKRGKSEKDREGSGAVPSSVENLEESLQNLPITGGGGGSPTPTTSQEDQGGSNQPVPADGTVAIDNKIEQAMDLVKSHLMYAVREEVDVLKDKIQELVQLNRTLEVENYLLKQNADQDTLSVVSKAQQDLNTVLSIPTTLPPFSFTTTTQGMGTSFGTSTPQIGFIPQPIAPTAYIQPAAATVLPPSSSSPPLSDDSIPSNHSTNTSTPAPQHLLTFQQVPQGMIVPNPSSAHHLQTNVTQAFAAAPHQTLLLQQNPVVYAASPGQQQTFLLQPQAGNPAAMLQPHQFQLLPGMQPTFLGGVAPTTLLQAHPSSENITKSIVPEASIHVNDQHQTTDQHTLEDMQQQQSPHQQPHLHEDRTQQQPSHENQQPIQHQQPHQQQPHQQQPHQQQPHQQQPHQQQVLQQQQAHQQPQAPQQPPHEQQQTELDEQAAQYLALGDKVPATSDKSR